PVRAARVLRAPARHDQPLRARLQLSLFQRRLSRRASRTAGRALVARAGDLPCRGPREPLAGAGALARRVRATRPRAARAAIAPAPARRRGIARPAAAVGPRPA